MTFSHRFNMVILIFSLFIRILRLHFRFQLQHQNKIVLAYANQMHVEMYILNYQYFEKENNKKRDRKLNINGINET